jgi:hypothetical protein
MQTAISKSTRFSCFQFTGDVEALKAALPKMNMMTCENAHKTEVWVEYLNLRPGDIDLSNALSSCRYKLRRLDWIFIDHDATFGYTIIDNKEFEKLYSIDPDPNYRYKNSLKVWHNGYEYVVAESPEAAVDSLLATGADYCAEEDDGWTELPAGQRLTVNDEELGPCTMLCCAWAEQGAGFICSTEY